MSVEIQTTSQGAILFDTAKVNSIEEAMFTKEYWRARHAVTAQAGGRGGVLFIRNDHYHWVLRHFHRGGLIAKLLRDKYFWRGAEQTRAFREWRLLHQLRAQGFTVPAPVATRYVRSGLWYRADLITEALPPGRTVAQALQGTTLTDEVWRKIGAAIARLHIAGVHHADLNAHNILLGESAQVFILDFDRGQIRTRGAWENAVLTRLKRSLNKICSEALHCKYGERDWHELVKGYNDRIKLGA
jgi:3-deoxy-D-manno-octulosonic acid kinase